MTTEIERLVVTLRADLGQYEARMRAAQAQTNARLSAIEGRFCSFQKRGEQAFAGVGFAAGTLGAYLGLQGVRTLTEYANAWTRTTRALDGGQQTFGITLKSAEELTQLANDARVDLDSYTKLYIRTSAAIRDYGFAAGTAEKVTSTLAKALKLGAASASEQTSTILQFSQALQKGKLDGDEFRTVMENAGVVQELLAKRLAVSKGEIIKLAAAGKLQIRDLVGAMTDGAEMVDRVFRGMPVTVDEAFMVLSNSMTEYIGQLDQAYGISQGYAGAIAALARNIETAGDMAIVLGAALLGAFSPAVLARMWSFAAASAAAQGPLGLVVAAAAAAGAAYVAFGDDIQPIPGQMANLHDVTAALAEVTEDRLTPAWESARLGAMALADAIRGTATDVNGAKTAVGEAVDWITRKMIALNAAILDTTVGRALYNLGDDVARNAEQRAIGRGFVESTTVSRPTPAALGGAGANDDPTARLSAYQREVNEIIKKTNALQAQAQVIGQSTYATERAVVARDLLTAAEETAKRTGTAVTAAQIADIQQMADKYAAVAANVAYLNAMQGAEERLQALRDENALIGLQGAALEEARVRQELLNAAKNAGQQADTARINAIAEETAALKHFQDTVNEVRDVSRDAMKSFIADLREGKSATEALGGVLDRLSDKLIDMAVNQLVENALGGLVGVLTGGSGGWAATVTKGFASGGYTGDGARMQPAGIVHKGEFVVNASATKQNRALLEAMNSGAGAAGARMPTSAPAADVGAGRTVVNVAPVFNMNGGPQDLSTFKSEVVPLIRETAKSAVADAMGRNTKFGKR